MTLRRGLAGHPAKDDEGLSLVELMIAMGVLSIVMVIVTNLFVTVVATTQAANAARSAVGQAGNAMDEIARVVRMGTSNAVSGNSTPDPAVVSGSGTALTVLSYVDTTASAPLPTKVAFTLDGGVLTEARTAFAASGSLAVITTAVTSRPVASGLTSVTFAYADSAGGALTPSVSGLSDAQRALVTTVTVTVTGQNTSGRTDDPIVLTNTVLLTNAALAAGPGS